MKTTTTPYGIDLADEFNSFHRARCRRLAARRRNGFRDLEAVARHQHIAHPGQAPEAGAHIHPPPARGQVRAQGQLEALGQGILARALQQQTGFPRGRHEALAVLHGADAVHLAEPGIPLQAQLGFIQRLPLGGVGHHLGHAFEAVDEAVEALHGEQTPARQEQTGAEREHRQEVLAAMPVEIAEHILEQQPQQAEERHEAFPSMAIPFSTEVVGDTKMTLAAVPPTGAFQRWILP